MMYHMAVAQSYRRRGIGTALMNLLEQRLKEKGCIRYYLLVAKDNAEAVRFYQEKGWEIMDLYALGKDLT
jgi:ribosomal protein S18 acetylase RimI-like enzyme